MFSVIIPLYNKAPYIEKAIRSVAAQTYQEFELILIDDGSKDDGFKIVEQLFDSLTPPLGGWGAFRQTNQGVSNARNNGVKLAKYDYIAFLDADDWWAPTFLEEMNGLIAEFPAKAIYSSAFYSVKNKKLRIIDLGVDVSFVKGLSNYSLLLSKGNTRPVCTGSCVISKTVFDEVEGFQSNLKLGEDFDLFFRCYLINGLVIINKPLFFYNQDVDPENRAISQRLYPKNESVFFNLNYPEQKYDKDVKHLVEFLKLRSYYPYYLAGMYLDEIKKDLDPIDFKSHFRKFYWRYKIIPRWIQNFWIKSKAYAYKIKRSIINENN